MPEDVSIDQDAWPDFELPSDVTRDAPSAAANNEPPVTPPATPPAPPATPPAQPPATPPATPPGGAPAGDGDMIPKHRLDEVIRERDADRAQLATLTQIVQRLQQQAPPAAAPPAADAAPVPTPEDLKVRERLLQVFPELRLLDELKDLAARKTDVLGVTDDAARWRTNEQAITDSYVDRTVNTAYDSVAALVLGEGKKGADLNDFQREGILAMMSRWIAADPKRAVRYDNHDDAVVAEFVTAYKAAMFDPVRRDANANLLERAGSPPAIPAGGSTSPVTPPAPATPNPNDEDAIHSSAWNRRGEFTSSR